MTQDGAPRNASIARRNRRHEMTAIPRQPTSSPKNATVNVPASHFGFRPGRVGRHPLEGGEPGQRGASYALDVRGLVGEARVCRPRPSVRAWREVPPVSAAPLTTVSSRRCSCWRKPDSGFLPPDSQRVTQCPNFSVAAFELSIPSCSGLVTCVDHYLPTLSEKTRRSRRCWCRSWH